MYFMDWLNITVWACFLPFVLVAAAYGVGSASLVEAFRMGSGSVNDVPGFELYIGFMLFLLKSIMQCTLRLRWRSWEELSLERYRRASL